MDDYTEDEPARQGVALECWDGETWLPYADVDGVLRYGVRLTDADALAQLHQVRDCLLEPLPQLSDTEAQTALRAPRR